MQIYFVFTHDLIQKGVKLETSYLAVRRKQQTEGGALEEMLNELVMDEDHEVLFKRLFLQAHAEVISKISVNYLMDTPTDLQSVYTNFSDFREDRDFVLFLNMHWDFPLQYKKSIEVKLEQYLIDYICYRWLETKSPDDAVTYKARLEPTLTEIRVLLVRKTQPLKRMPSFP